ncbi:MAG: methyltransferase domain-containing protein [Actinomycetota bacterium]|nr:methyltransferase domain-containing protein [Actinomycetota bacterium]
MFESLRTKVRTSIPLSTEVYEYTDSRIKLHRSRSHLRELIASKRELWLDIGGGYRSGTNGWLTVDISNECDIYWDLRLGMPFPDNSVSKIYSSHLFEHLTYNEAQVLLGECMRVLKPGGSFSIVVPNAKMYIEWYTGAREVPSDAFGWLPAYNQTTAIDALNYVAYMAGEHKYMFDQENLLHILRAKGFENVAKREFDPQIDMAERDFESIYAIGFKPSN